MNPAIVAEPVTAGSMDVEETTPAPVAGMRIAAVVTATPLD
jgi:hypothetical protein